MRNIVINLEAFKIKKFTLIFFCQSIDQDDPIIADTLNRAKSFAQNPRVKKTIIVTTRGKSTLSDHNITTINLEVPKEGRMKALVKLYRVVLQEILKGKIVFYCYMTPTIPILLAPFKIFSRFKIVTWFAHSQFRPLVKFNLKYLSDLWFAPNLSHAKLNYKNLRVVGQAVDLDLFKPQPCPKKFDMITVGRLTPVKKIHTIIESIHLLKTLYHQNISLCLCGDAYSKEDINYKNELKILISKYQLDLQIDFKGNVLKDNLPLLLNQSRIFIFPQDGAISKATVEALSTGLPIIICEDASDFLSSALNQLFFTKDDPHSLALKIKMLLSLSENEYARLSKECREDVLKRGGTKELFERISYQIEDLF